MTVIEIPDEQAAALKARAAAQGRTLNAWLEKLAQEESPAGAPQKPFKTGRGMLAKYGTARSVEEIDENRRDMFTASRKASDDRRHRGHAYRLCYLFNDERPLCRLKSRFAPPDAES